MGEQIPAEAAALYLRGGLRALSRGELLQVREHIANALRLLEAATHTPVNPCPRCEASATYLAGEDFICTLCGHAWNPFTQPVDKGMDNNDARPGTITDDQLRSIGAAFTMLGIGGKTEQVGQAAAHAGRVLFDLRGLSYREAGDLAAALVEQAAERARGRGRYSP